MNKSLIVAVLVLVLVAVKQSYGTPMEKRTMADALNSQIMSQGASNLRGQAFMKFLQNLRKQYGDMTVRAPQSKRVTAEAYMNSQLRKQYFQNQASALREALQALQRGKRNEDDIDEMN